MIEMFPYVIARPWEEDEPNNLCIYTIHNSEVHYGTMKEAEGLLRYVRHQKEDDSDRYEIYRITYQKI